MDRGLKSSSLKHHSLAASYRRELTSINPPRRTSLPWNDDQVSKTTNSSIEMEERCFIYPQEPRSIFLGVFFFGGFKSLHRVEMAEKRSSSGILDQLGSYGGMSKKGKKISDLLKQLIRRCCCSRGLGVESFAELSEANAISSARRGGGLNLVPGRSSPPPP